MGLDMYLYRRQYAHPKLDGKLEMTRQGKLQQVEVEVPTVLQEEVAYWRKANHIHGWFVDNVQDGKDDCQEYVVTQQQLAKLLETVREVIAASKLIDGEVTVGASYESGEKVPIFEKGKIIADPTVAKRLLPTRQGFFFGSYEYDENYHDDLCYTQFALEKALQSPGLKCFTYQSSW